MNKKDKNQTVALFYYVALDANYDTQRSVLEPTFEDPLNPNRVTGISGVTSSLGKFKVSFAINKGSAPNVHQFFHTAVASKGPDQFTNDILQKLRLYGSNEGGARSTKNNIIGLDPNFEGNDPANFVAIQINFKLPFSLDIVFQLEDAASNDDQNRLLNDKYTQMLKEKESIYDQRFETTFGLQAKGVNEKSIQFAQAALR